MNEISATCDNSMEDQVAQAVDQFRERLRRGEQPDVEELIQQYPQAAAVLRSILPALPMIQPGPASLNDEPKPVDELVSGTLGDFRLLGEVGRGGMGIVYEAEQISLGRRVALKVLPFAATMDKRQLQRFHNEARAAASLEHPNIVPVYGVGCERGVHYYAMRFIDGQSLDTALQILRDDQQPAPPPDTDATVAQNHPEGGLAAKTGDTLQARNSTLKSSKRGHDDWHRVAELAFQAADALEHAHQSGVIHRDVKPANLLLDGEGKLWITDFGLAQIQSDTRLTMTGDLVGTLRYMSPEQALAKRVIVDHRTDIYSLGATFYEMLTLKPVFAGQDRQELLRQIAFEEPVPPRKLNRAIPVELETIVLKAVEKNPADRYGTAKEMADDLKRFLNDEPTLARRPTLWLRARKWSRRHKAAVRATAVALVVVLAVLVATAGWLLRDHEAQETERVNAVAAAIEEAHQLEGNRRAREHATRKAETEGAVTMTLREAQAFQSQSRWLDALAAAKKAKTLLGKGDDHPELGRQVHETLADLEMIAKLEKARMRGASSKNGRFDLEAQDLEFALAFRDYGIDVEALSVTEAANRIRARPIGFQLATALDSWSQTRWTRRKPDNAGWEHLQAVARAADFEDEWRNRLRDALARDDRKELKELAAVAPIKNLPASTLSFLGLSLRERRMPDQAAAVLRQAQQRYPGEFWINEDLTLALRVSDHPNWNDVVRFAQAAFALRPESAVACCNLGTALFENKQLDEAVAVFRQAINLEPHAMAFSNLGGALVEKRQWDDAIKALHEAIKLDPDYAGAYVNLGSAFMEKQQWDDAIDALQKAKDRNPSLWQPRVDLGYSFYRNGQVKEAISEYEQLNKKQPKLPFGYAGLARVLANTTDQKFHDPKEAVALALKAVQLQKRESESWTVLGMAHYRNGEWKAAVEALNQSLKLQAEPDSEEFFFLAMAQTQLGDKKQAKTWYDKGVQWMDKNSPKDAELQRFRAEAAEVLGINDANPKGKN